jgi:hypothetical protein
VPPGRIELARNVLQAISEGRPVATLDALQIRNWAVNPDDAMLSLEEIATRILREEAFPSDPSLICMACGERERLTKAYLEATHNVFGAGKVVPNMTSPKWKAATSAARAACKLALENLKRHCKEHGCQGL